MDTLRQVFRFLLGRPSDWHLKPPSVPRLRLRRSVVGPLAILATVAASWFAFAGASGAGPVALGLWVGAAAILLMSWSFILAVRPKALEPLFGGLDSMYRSHRWAGALSIACMWLHTSIEPEIDGGIRGASRSIAKAAEDLAETGQTMLYVLVGLSIVRLFPYRWWRWTHKLLGVPFAFASWHFFTAEKTYANGSPWGWWFGAWMLVGLGAWLLRVVGIDMVRRGRHYRVASATHSATTTELVLTPVGKALDQHAGQFAFIKLDVPGLREPHPFTIASSPEDPNLRFMIRHLGDWSRRLPDADLVGASVMVEGPFGEFSPFGHETEPAVWVAGGVGITPFLAAIDSMKTESMKADPGQAPLRPPTLLYAVRSTDDNPMLDHVLAAAEAGLLHVELFTPSAGRMSPEDLDRLFPNGLANHHVALCGPAGLVSAMATGAHQRGATSIETEDFDIRQGFGPDRSAEIADLVSERTGSALRASV